MDIVVKIYDWVFDRMAEPSSYAAIGAVVMGLGILFDVSVLFMSSCAKSIFAKLLVSCFSISRSAFALFSLSSGKNLPTTSVTAGRTAVINPIMFNTIFCYLYVVPHLIL